LALIESRPGVRVKVIKRSQRERQGETERDGQID
jgi:hypothetical protein